MPSKKKKKKLTKNTVIFQKPNTPIIIAIVSEVLKLIASGPLYDIASVTFIASLAIWAYLEIVKGVNIFRRILGIAALLFLVLLILHRI